jgi:hypothetical protein
MLSPKLFIKTLILSLSFFSVILHAQTNAVPPSNLGTPTYPNSGMTKSWGDVTGGTASSAESSNLQGLSNSNKTPSTSSNNRQEQEEKSESTFKVGPYNREGEYQYFFPD